jgi:hypothetical protein
MLMLQINVTLWVDEFFYLGNRIFKDGKLASVYLFIQKPGSWNLSTKKRFTILNLKQGSPYPKLQI